MRALSRTFAVAAALCFVLLGTGTASVASATEMSSAVTCSQGAVAPGTYASLTITGSCAIPFGTVNVRGNLIIARNAVLFAASPAATLTVDGNALVHSGASFILGCSQAFGCKTETEDRINGNVVANQPLALIFHSNTIGGNLSLHGGGGGLSCAGRPQLQGAPAYSTFEDNHIGGNALVSGYASCWFGFIRNEVRGNVVLTHNTLLDPDAMEIVTNKVSGNLICFHNDPAPQVGDSEGATNIVSGQKLGQCAHV